MTTPDDQAAWLHLPSGRWRIAPHDAAGLPERLRAAAAAGEVVLVALEDADGARGVAVVAPAAVPVVLTGPPSAFDPPPGGHPTW